MKRRRKRRSPAGIFGLIALSVVGAGLVAASVATQLRAAEPVTIVAVGDIACSPTHVFFNGGAGTDTWCRMKATSDLALSLEPDAALVLGDLQYEDGTLAAFQRSYDTNWGRLKEITRPAVGNHEYQTKGAKGYFDYFGAAAGIRGLGFYSYDLGDWHVVALNSQCSEVGCGVGSVQEQWLRADLAANPKLCTLAYWHHPRFSSGGHGNDDDLQPLWQALQDHEADVVLAGHDHNYERFAPQRADGVFDRNGIRSFVVGSGGKNLDPFRKIKANSVVRNNTDFGVLKMTLDRRSYNWQFINVDGEVKDKGEADCVTEPAGRSAATTPEPTPRPTP
jgi:hypothetical protein